MNTNLKRNDRVTINRPLKTLNNQFQPGDEFRVLSVGFTLVRLSRVSDKAKLETLISYLTGHEVAESNVPRVAPVETAPEKLDLRDIPHSDESGPSREIVVATVLAGKDSATLTIHLTPAEEKIYNEGMARLAELG